MKSKLFLLLVKLFDKLFRNFYFDFKEKFDILAYAEMLGLCYFISLKLFR
jgi:hypothetical protein